MTGKARWVPILILTSAACLAACVAGPGYAPPTVNLPDHFSMARAPAAPDLSRNAWWTGFNDPVLTNLVYRGLAQNLTIRQAQERVNAARALADGAGGVTSGALGLEATRSDDTGSSTVDSSEAGLRGNWLLDFFGKARNTRDSSLYSAQAIEADAQAATLGYLSEIAGAYIDLRYNETLLHLKRLDAASRMETRDQTQSLAAAGNATQIDVAQSMALVSASQAEIPVIEANARRQANRIATLLGVPAGTLMLAPTARQPLPAHGAPAGIPADLVRNRPDIRAAERRYAAAVARIGVAEAELYPSVQLSGTITAGRIDGVTENSWSFGPSLTFPIFGRKALRANVAAAQADARQALLRWQETVLAAVEQVENSLYAGQKYAAASVSARETVAQFQKSLDLSRRLAAEQSVTSLDLIDIELLISDARETQAQSMRQVALEYVQLNVALGAGYASGAGAPESTASLP